MIPPRNTWCICSFWTIWPYSEFCSQLLSLLCMCTYIPNINIYILPHLQPRLHGRAHMDPHKTRLKGLLLKFILREFHLNRTQIHTDSTLGLETYFCLKRNFTLSKVCLKNAWGFHCACVCMYEVIASVSYNFSTQSVFVEYTRTSS